MRGLPTVKCCSVFGEFGELKEGGVFMPNVSFAKPKQV